MSTIACDVCKVGRSLVQKMLTKVVSCTPRSSCDDILLCSNFRLENISVAESHILAILYLKHSAN